MGFRAAVFVGFVPEDWEQFDQFKEESKNGTIKYTPPLEWLGDPEDTPDIADLGNTFIPDTELRFYNCPVVRVCDGGTWMVQYDTTNVITYENLSLRPDKLLEFENLFKRHGIEGSVKLLWGGYNWIKIVYCRGVEG